MRRIVQFGTCLFGLGLVSCPDRLGSLGAALAARATAAVEASLSGAGLSGEPEVEPRVAVLAVAAKPPFEPKAEPARSQQGPPASGETSEEDVRAPELDAAWNSDDEAPDAAEPPTLLALGRETLVYSRPDRGSVRSGYLRAGTIARRSAEPLGRGDCSGGWYRVEPDGYVCVGATATLEVAHPIKELLFHPPDRHGALPYYYGLTKGTAPVLHPRLPTRAEARALEPEWNGKRGRAWDEYPAMPVPEVLGEGRPLFVPLGYAQGLPEPVRAAPRSGFAFFGFYDSGDRLFGLSTDYALVGLDQVKPVQASSFHGLVLEPSSERRASLPVVFVQGGQGHRYTGSFEAGLRYDRPLSRREAVSVTGKVEKSGGREYLETADGGWIQAPRRISVPRRETFPPWVSADTRWLDVSIEAQTLVAYVGTEPAYVTLVSTGADGLGDPETTHSTPQGHFRIHTKHVTATMASDVEGDVYELRDVPYVQYFEAGYALHAAYWHDAFGRPKSHGCINLSPLDARWLFHFSEPAVPQKWHGAYAKDGTSILIRP